MIIVGSGFAGLGAAEIVSEHRLDVLMIDENFHAGGQLLRKTAGKTALGDRIESDRLKLSGYRIIDHIARKNIPFMNRTQVLGIYPENQICIEDKKGRILDLKAEFIICATGARERFLPFKGWTLPGVVSTGAAQVLIKSAGILPAREILIGGFGPLLFALANEVVDNKGRVISVLDQTSLMENLRILRLWRHQTPRLIEGMHYLTRLLTARVPVRSRVRIIEARGSRHLEEVITAKTDSNGMIESGTEKTYETGSLAVGYGFVPNIELPQIAGCEIAYREDRGGWIVGVDRFMETSVKNIYAAGEITGIAGAKKSYIEGQIAALKILNELGLIRNSHFQRKFDVLARQRNYELQFGKFLNRLYRLPEKMYETISDDTIICRCEDVNMGEIRRRISNGFISIGSLKKATRCGMGNCQGRTCGPILCDILATYAAKSHNKMKPLSVRFPAKVVRLDGLAGLNAD